jgi:F-type H+-transporting ATPase subunit epsilon
MLLKISSPSGIIFEGEIAKVILPTEKGEITIMPNHIPLITVVKPGLVKLVPLHHQQTESFKDGQYLFEEDKLVFSISKGIALIDGKSIKLTTSVATTSPQESDEKLSQMKENLQHQIKTIRAKGNMEEMEKIINQLEKINADMKLNKLKR